MSTISTLLSQSYPYQHPQLIQSHILTLLSKLPSLSPKLLIYTHDNAKEAKLVVLEGTVPMYYRRSRYNIPVRIWLTEGYPQYPPLVYVVPTDDMELKPGHKHMDHTGRCYLPYLSEWKIGTHNLYDLCNYLGTLFGEDPPVFAKQKKAPQTSTSTPPQHMNQSYSAGYNNSQQPQYQQNFNPMAQSQQYPSSTTTAHRPTTFPPHQQQPQQQQPHIQALQQQALIATRRALVQKIQSKLSLFRKEQQERLEQTLKDQREQQARLSFQESESNRLNQQLNLADQNIEKLSHDMDKLRKLCEEDESRGDIAVEDIIEFADALSKQDVELAAEDSAIEDCFYNLDKALQRDLVSTDVFLRTIRQLARKQFEVRALNEKVKRERSSEKFMRANS